MNDVAIEEPIRPRFVVDALINGEGFVIVDRWWKEPMIGPYSKRQRAETRAAEFEADPSKVPPKVEGSV